MRAQVALIAVTLSLSLACLTPIAASAARNPAMEACSKQWEDMKSAGKTEGQTWPTFWSQCSKDFAAKNGGDAASADKSAKTATDTGTETTPAAKPAKSKKTASKSPDEDDTPTSAQQKRDCDQKWDANKAKTGAHGWHDYFQFMSKCI